ncbi:MAG: hypothetical protein AAGH79_07310 [Bacteroidota bacterium]
MIKKFVLTAACGFLFLGLNTLQAQEFTAKGGADIMTTSSDDNWSFFVDEEQKIYYIDFETINVNLNDIAVKNAAGKIVFQDEVFNLPVNTIYELDMHTFPKGKYVVELRSYTGVLRREFFVR